MNLFFSFNGRIGRSNYWLGFFIYGTLTYIGAMVMKYFYTQNDASDILLNMSIIICFVGVYILFAVTAKRFHDLGQSGWWSLLILTPFIFFMPIYLGLVGGDRCSNEYGPCPRAVRRANERT